METRASTKTLNNVLYVPQINQNLVSVGQLMESGYSLLFDNGVCVIKDKKGILLLCAKMTNRCFNADLKEICWTANMCKNDESVLWHKRLGHYNYAALNKMVELQMARGLPNIHDQGIFCEACQLGESKEKLLSLILISEPMLNCSSYTQMCVGQCNVNP